MTGLGNYSRLVIESLARLAPESKFDVYAPDMKENPRLKPLLQLPNVEFRLPQGILPTQKGSLWRTWGITADLKREKPDIFHGLSNELPLNIRDAGVVSVVTIHDLIYRRLPYCYTFPDRAIYDYKYSRSCRNADAIIAVSECTKKDIMELYHIPEEKIHVVYQGCDDSFKRVVSDEEKQQLRQKYELPQRFIVQVGTLERRKNLELTVKALPYLPDSLHLVAVGRDRMEYKKQVMETAARLGVTHRIHYIKSIPFAELPTLYQCAEASTYPSIYEGFGIPVLESLNSRCPTVAATGSCLEEAGGDGAIYVNPDDVREMAEALKAITATGADNSALIDRGLRHAARFSNDSVGVNIMKVYRETYNKSRPLTKTAN